MPYTPELNESAICTLRRLAWSANMPMSKVLEAAVVRYSIRTNRESVCKTCKDPSRCAICYFNGQQLKKKLQGMRHKSRKAAASVRQDDFQQDSERAHCATCQPMYAKC